MANWAIVRLVTFWISLTFILSYGFFNPNPEIINVTYNIIKNFIQLFKIILNTNNSIKSPYREEIQRRTISNGTKKAENTTYELFAVQERTKFIPNNGDPVLYTEWQNTTFYEEAISEEFVETKSKVFIGYTYSGISIYSKYIDRERINVKDLKTGNIIYGQWSNIKEYQELSDTLYSLLYRIFAVLFHYQFFDTSYFSEL